MQKFIFILVAFALTPWCFAFQGVVRSTSYVRPTLWLPLKTDASSAGSTTFTTSTTAITYGSVGSRNASLFDGVSSSSQISITNNQASTNLGTGDFTFEAWVYMNTFTSASYLIDYRPTSDQTANYPAIRFSTTGQLRLQAISAGAASNVYTTAATVPTGAWTHVALVRSSGVCVFYINGTASGSYSTVQTFTADTGVSRPAIGASGWSGSGTIDGSIYDLKLWVGKVVYTGNFTPTP